MKEVKVVIDIARSARVTLSGDEALRLLAVIREMKGPTRDLTEAYRIIASFEEYYNYSRRRFEDYIFVPKDPRESLEGKTVIQKLRLIRNEGDFVEIVFDRRMDLNAIIEALKTIGCEKVDVISQSF
ncbi:MAG: hypothetical protein ACO2OS_02050 [Thermosphaera aggregans]|jgi:hypothetical protein|uniref:hypothetical protein n=1 Tax=Thermosphaera aggregans TaxID=54254 RepID=UPI003C056326